MRDTSEIIREAKASMGKMGKDYAEFMGAFGGLSKHAKSEGVLSTKVKELIGLALGVAEKCDWCIALHVEGCLAAGATREEILEACHPAVLMGGGPSLMYTQVVMKALDDLGA